jgi:hypothetical protein
MSRNLFEDLEPKVVPYLKRICSTRRQRNFDYTPETYAGLADHLIKEFKIKVQSRRSFIFSLQSLMKDYELELPGRRSRGYRPAEVTELRNHSVEFALNPDDPEVILAYADSLYNSTLNIMRHDRNTRAKAWTLYCLALALFCKRGEVSRAREVRKRLSRRLSVARVKMEDFSTHIDWNTLADKFDL